MGSGGYTPAEIDAFHLSDIDAIYTAWNACPPVAESVAAFFGYKAPEAPAKAGESLQGNSVAELRMRFPDGIMRG